MKLSAALLLAAASISLLLAAAFADPSPVAAPFLPTQGLGPPAPPLLASRIGPGTLFEVKPAEKNRASEPRQSLPPAPLNSTGGPWVLTNSGGLGSNVLAFVGRPRLSVLGRLPPGHSIAPPGVYESKPYKSIIIVPGPHPDDRCLIPAVPTEPMPTLRPGLRLIPRGK